MELSKLKNQNIFYWSPSLVKIATNQAVIQSASAVNKFDSNFTATIINFLGNFKNMRKKFLKIKLIFLIFIIKNFLIYYQDMDFYKVEFLL